MKKIVLCLLSLMLLFVHSNFKNVYADELSMDINSINDYMRNDIQSYINSNDLNYSIDNINISVNEEILNYSQTDAQSIINEELNNIKSYISSVSYNLTETTTNNENGMVQPYVVYHGNGRYTAEIWAGIPAIGWSTIKQDFSASISNGKINSISMIGAGRMTGISWGTYTHNTSWYTLTGSRLFADIYVKGQINYVRNLVNLSMDATFLESLKVSGSKLIER